LLGRGTAALLLSLATIGPVRAAAPAPLPGTQLLTVEGDLASQMVAGIDKFLLRELEKSVKLRPAHWQRDLSSAEKYNLSIEPNRARLRHLLGVRDARLPGTELELCAGTRHDALVGKGANFEVNAARWPAFADVTGEGLLLTPIGRKPLAIVIAIPDAGQSPEQLVGLVAGCPAESQFARRLAESGCTVVVPALISREVTQKKLTNREYLYRSAFELGRHIIGYELLKVLSLVDHFEGERGGLKLAVIGWGEGGLLALHVAALDPRIDAACVSGYFDSRQTLWQEPLDRNLFGFLKEFGDAEVASMIAPRPLIVEVAKGPELVIPPGTGGGPGRLVTPALASARAELERAQALVKGIEPEWPAALSTSGNGTGPAGAAEALTKLLAAIAPGSALADIGAAPAQLREKLDPQARQARQMHEIDRHNQELLVGSADVRRQFMSGLDTSSAEKYAASSERYRKIFADDVIGRFDIERLPPNVRTRRAYDEPKWTGYEVMMDVFPDVFAYGILLLPKDIKPGERRPVVVCQHGLEGRPQDVVAGDAAAYHDFAARLAERGFITLAPQNPYIFGDRFRGLQRKSNPLQKSLFSIIVPQHQQITDWLKTLPQVDGKRIGFYGLSYGGKTAMRVPPLVSNYCLSICSADFNEWVWKNASHSSYSYVLTGEYEIFEFDLGNTFNYAEMAALIAPRPFMVERGHFDGVAPDEAVGYEFAKVRFLYEARLKLDDRCTIEWFTGPHTINGRGTFDFLHRHLQWPKR